MFIKNDHYYDENGKLRERKYFGKDEEHITSIIDSEVNTYEHSEPPPEPNLNTIGETQLIIMEAMADQYEQQIEQNLINMEVQATIYETVLELKGEV